jgi:hypothetical protein
MIHHDSGWIIHKNIQRPRCGLAAKRSPDDRRAAIAVRLDNARRRRKKRPAPGAVVEFGAGRNVDAS